MDVQVAISLSKSEVLSLEGGTKLEGLGTIRIP